MNLANFSFEHIFNNENYQIEPIKTVGTFEPKRWLETFGKSLTRNITEAKILHSNTGLELPLKRYSISKKVQILEVAGIVAYNKKSDFKRAFLLDNVPYFANVSINRCDVAIDFEKMPSMVIKRIEARRGKLFKFKNTMYYKTKSEKKSNLKFDIKIYDKQLKEKLDFKLVRLEVSFKSAYINKVKFEDIEILFEKMEKTIKNFTGIDVQISL